MKHSLIRTAIALMFASFTTQISAQNSSIPGDTLINMLVRDWERGKAYTNEYLDAMPEAKYSFKAQDSVRSFAQQMLHLAQANAFFMMTATGTPSPFGFRNIEQGSTAQTADSVRYFVDKSYDFAIETIRKIDPKTLLDVKSFNMGQTISGSKLAWLYKAFEHQTHHRGQATIYIRLVGIKPPQEKLF